MNIKEKVKQHQMIYLADDTLKEKINYMKKYHQVNISAVIRDLLNKKYDELYQLELYKNDNSNNHQINGG